jgi:hypothetical protein
MAAVPAVCPVSFIFYFLEATVYKFLIKINCISMCLELPFHPLNIYLTCTLFFDFLFLVMFNPETSKDIMSCSSGELADHIRVKASFPCPFLSRKAVFNQPTKVFLPLFFSKFCTSIYTFFPAPRILCPFPCQFRVAFCGPINLSSKSFTKIHQAGLLVKKISTVGKNCRIFYLSILIRVIFSIWKCMSRMDPTALAPTILALFP